MPKHRLRLLARVNPLELEVALAVQKELAARQDEADALRAQQVARAQYEADLAGQRYRRVDPNHRWVAASLEAEWNAALTALESAQRLIGRPMDKSMNASASGTGCC
jgi:hypothetical protein